MTTPTIKQEIAKWTCALKNDIGSLLLNRLEKEYGAKRANQVLQEELEDWEAFVGNVQDQILTEIDLAVDEMQYDFVSLSED